MIKRKIRPAIALLLGVMLMAQTTAAAFAVSQSEIDELTRERDELKAQRQQKQAVVDQLESEQADVLEQKLAMDERNMITLQQIQLNNDEIALYDDMIAEKAKELDAALALEASQLERYRVRVRAMEESGGYNVLALIARSSNFSELLTAIDDMGEIMNSDQQLWDDYIAARENTESVKAEYEAFKADLEAKQEQLRAEQEELEKDIDEANQLILALQQDIDSKSAQLDELSAAEDAANAVIDKLVAELEAQRKAAAAANGQSTVGPVATCTGSFGWPCPSCTYLTSRFGPRTHPVTGKYKNHTGIDIGAASGADITAADGGEVVLAGTNGGYGNCVMLDHGNGYVTLYGHMSSIAVSKGQIVSKGATIGYVGSTGMSTGPHLHFEVLLNGDRIDPEQFYSGLTYSADCGV